MKPMDANGFCELTEGEMHLWDSFKRWESKLKVVPPVNTELFLRALPCCTVRDAQCSSISQAIPMRTLAAVPKPIQPHRHGKAAAWLELSLLTQHLKSGLNLLLYFSLNTVFPHTVVTHLAELVLHFLDPPDFRGVNCGSIRLSFFFSKFFFVLVLEEHNDKIIKIYPRALAELY